MPRPRRPPFSHNVVLRTVAARAAQPRQRVAVSAVREPRHWRGATPLPAVPTFGEGAWTYRDLYADAALVAQQLRSPTQTPAAYVAALRRRHIATERAKAAFLAQDAAAFTQHAGVADRLTPTAVIAVQPSYGFTAGLAAAWMAGMMAVPISTSSALSELQYVVDNAQPKVIIASKHTLHLARTLRSRCPNRAGMRIVCVGDRPARHSTRAAAAAMAAASQWSSGVAAGLGRLRASCDLGRGFDAAEACADALMVYTSGTTGKPKGVVHAHTNVNSQVQCLQRAWRWTAQDKILNTLPLYHVHGLVNVTMCALASGAHCLFAHPFNGGLVASRLAVGDVTLFMAVPPAFAKLEETLSAWPAETRAAWVERTRQAVRLFVSGSSALPTTVRQRVEELIGAVILERYGMTEIGMALSQPYAPATERIAGTVGVPLPGVAVALRRDAPKGGDDAQPGAGAPSELEGELVVDSPNVFQRYWRRPDATLESFVIATDKTATKKKHSNATKPATRRWFATGDVVRHGEYFRILGRMSADILKVKSFKVSALEIETALLDSGLLKEVAVFAAAPATPGVASELSDTVVCACVPAEPLAATQAAADDFIDRLRKFANRELTSYRRPQVYVLMLHGLPRNAMGKVNKKDLARTHCFAQTVAALKQRKMPDAATHATVVKKRGRPAKGKVAPARESKAKRAGRAKGSSKPTKPRGGKKSSDRTPAAKLTPTTVKKVKDAPKKAAKRTAARNDRKPRTAAAPRRAEPAVAKKRGRRPAAANAYEALMRDAPIRVADAAGGRDATGLAGRGGRVAVPAAACGTRPDGRVGG